MCRIFIFSVSFFLCGIILSNSALAYTSPGKPTGYVNDFAKILSASDVSTLDAQVLAVYQKTGAEIAVVTVPSLGDETIETYATKLFEEWQIGTKGKDNGLLILIAPNDRIARIEVGYGLEGTIPDITASNIVRNVMLPAFKSNDYVGGIGSAVDVIDGLIQGDPSVMSAVSNPSSAPSKAQWEFYLFIGIIVLNVLAKILGATKSWWLGGVIGAVAGTIIGFIWGFFYAGLIGIIALTVLGLLFDYIVSKRPPGSSGGGGFWPIFFGGGGSGGFGGGGFGGFGGGSSGGGGASGRW